MSHQVSLTASERARCMSHRGVEGVPPESSLQSCDPDDEVPASVTRFDFELDWRAVYRETHDSHLKGGVPDEVQQALR